MIKTEKWDQVFLGEIANEISERVDNPSQSGFEMFVGLEHFVSGDLKIKQWGSTKNLVSAMKKFQKGNILFARRNAYLKRASIVEFDGVCSGDAFVIREKKDRLVPGFLAFIFNSESLWHYANSHAAGTMSKRVKWRDLAKYSFKLPPLDEQKSLADLLWSVDEAIEKEISCYQKLKILKASKTKDLFSKHIKEKIMLGNLCVEKPSYGATASAVEHKPGMPRYIRITDISEEGDLLESDIKGIGAKKYDKYRLEDGDLLIARTAAVGRAFVYKRHYGDCVFAGYLIKFRINMNKVLPEYIFCYLHSPIFQNWVRKTTRIGLQANINAKEYSEHLIPIPSICIQKKIVESIKELKRMEESLSCQINQLKVIKKQIIDQIFRGKP